MPYISNLTCFIAIYCLLAATYCLLPEVLSMITPVNLPRVPVQSSTLGPLSEEFVLLYYLSAAFQ